MSTSTIDCRFRLGVTGSARVALDRESALWSQLLDSIGAIRTAVVASNSDPRLVGIKSINLPKIRLISPLADGADRLVAMAALDLQDRTPDPGCAIVLEVTMPFEQAAYEQTFAKDKPDNARQASVTAFRELLARAEGRVLELDGAITPDTVRHDSYTAVGRTVVRNCDLLIVIEDPDQISKGPGGTRDIARYAGQVGVPMLIFDGAGASPPRWQGEGDPDQNVSALMTAYIRDTLLPPESHGGHPPSLPVRVLRRWLRVEPDPLRRYLAENGKSNFNIWRGRDALMGTMQRRAARKVGLEVQPDRDNHWLWHALRRYQPASPSSSFAAQLSTKYQQRYRTSYLAILSAGALALIIAGTSMGQFVPKWTIWVELGLLLFILILWLINEAEDWHQRYIAYRILAELNRFTLYLGDVARTAPNARLDQAALGPQRWVAWLYAATVRAEPMITGAITPERKAQVREAVSKKLIDQQLDFHRRRKIVSLGTHRLLGFFGQCCFGITFLCVFVKAVFHPIEGVSNALAIVAFVLPIMAAALFSLRAYEELELLESQSEWLIQELKAGKLRLSGLDVTQPLALQPMGNETVKVTQLLMQDVSGWAQMFKVKAVEG